MGDKISAYFMSRAGGELRFTMKIGGGGSGTEQLENAFQSGIPVEGKIEKEIKGGFEVKLSGHIRAFCPYSQSGMRQSEPADLIGQSLSFKITQFSERGVILSFPTGLLWMKNVSNCALHCAIP